MIISFEGRRGIGMDLTATTLVYMQLCRDKNRRVVCDFDPTKKHKHFDEKEFLREIGNLEGK